ncbi:MAG: cysteine hydrolase [Clostridia bacterium]|nr:cysteine hydrolase [Clostridia bacterium]
MKKCLVVVDYQNDFVTGSLGFPGAEVIGPAIAARIQKARADGEDVVFTLDTHGPDYLDSHEGRHLPVAHCVHGTDGWQIASPVAGEIRDEDLRLEKDTFGSRDLFEHLRREGYDAVELCGLVTDICVSTNAALARTALPEADIVVDADLTASADPEKFRSALDVLRSLHVDVLHQDAAG